MPPSFIGPYRVLETLGSGGAGTVYRALDKRTQEEVALKLLSSGPALDPKAARRLAREFETLSELSHRNVVKVFDTGVFHGYPYLAMELVEGLTLRNYLSLSGGEDWLTASSSGAGSLSVPRARSLKSFIDGDDDDSWDSDRGGDAAFSLSSFNEESPSEELAASSGPDSIRAFADAADEPDTQDSDGDDHVPWSPDAASLKAAASAPTVDLKALNRPERVVRLKDSFIQLAEALSYIHAHGLIHRDLKPSNIMVDEDRMVRLMDFGLAKFLAEEAPLTAGGRLVGTFRYMSPEQIMGEPVDSRADLYSMGVIIYEMLAGRPPFDAATPYELWQKVVETEPPSILSLNPGADVQMARIANRLMRKNPEERYQTAEEVIEALSE